MKRLLLLLTLGAALTCPSFAQSTNSTNTPPSPPPPGGGHHGGMLTDEERQELHAAHDAALQADPDLAAEGKDLQAKMQAYHQKLDAAMIKADPKVEPIITKMEAAHPHRDGPDAPPPSGK